MARSFLALASAVLVVGAALALAASAPAADRGAAQSRVTIFARPAVIGWADSALLFGTARGASAQDVVRVEVKECGSPSFRLFAEAHALGGGGWSTPAGTGVTSTYRAVWRGARSAHVTIRQAAWVALERARSGTRFAVSVSAKRSLWRKRVVIQRRDAGRWRTLRHVVLVDSVRSTGAVSVSRATFALRVPRGTVLRALLPEPQARPCYVASASRAVRA